MHNENKKGDTIYQGVVEEDILVGGEGTNTTGGLGGVKAGHSRFFCEKCQSPYDLPQGATSWRCRNCMTFNSTAPPECPCCTIQ